MSIISLEQADRLFWLGRYSERVYTTIRLYFNSYDELIDGSSDLYSNFCRSIDIPDVYGKEKRKAAPGKEGKLGVEGMSREIILESLRKAGATIEGEEGTGSHQITKQDLMELGLSGGADASAKRLALLKKLNLPEHMSANAMLQALNLLYTLEELTTIVEKLENEHG